LRKLKKEAKKRHFNIGFRVWDMKNIPYEGSSFDSVICMWNAFSELTTESEQIATIREVYRVLKEGGMAIIEMRNHRSSGLVEKNLIDGYEAMPSYNHT
jgi:ubiquinone/menaquinone biosynthesis C-methylase UbiE